MSRQEQQINSFQKVLYQKLSEVVDVANFEDFQEHYIFQINDNNSKPVFYDVINKLHLDLFINKEITLNEYQAKFSKSEIMKKIMLVHKDYLSTVSKYGAFVYSYLTELENVEKIDRTLLISKDIFKDMANSEFVFVEYIENENRKYTLKDSSGKYFMEPILLDGLEGQLQSTDYHLDEFTEHLSKRDDIAFISNRDRFSLKEVTLLHCPLKGDEEGIGGVISDTEVHGEGSVQKEEENISIVFYPKQEEIKKILEWKNEDARKPKNFDRKVWNIYSYISRDLLGGHDFYKYPPKEPEIAIRKFKH